MELLCNVHSVFGFAKRCISNVYAKLNMPNSNGDRIIAHEPTSHSPSITTLIQYVV